MGIFQQFPYTNFHEMNLDQIIKIMREMQDAWEETKAEWASYKDFIDNYFANLDLDQETYDALLRMISNGTFNDVVDPVIAAQTAIWLAANIGPTTPAIDASLTVSGAGADAAVTGYAITKLNDYVVNASNNAFNFITPTWEQGSMNTTGDITTNQAIRTNYFDITAAETLFLYIPTGYAAAVYYYTANNEYVARVQNLSAGIHELPVSNRVHCRIAFSYSPLANISVSEGAKLTVAYWNIYGSGYDLYPTYDTTDRGAEIADVITRKKVCKLAPGDYYISTVVMPANAEIIGTGDNTRLISLGSAYPYMVRAQIDCEIRNLAILGSLTNITVTDDWDMHATPANPCGIRIEGTGSDDTQRFRVRIDNVSISGIAGAGIFCNMTGYNPQAGNHFNNIFVRNCNAGIVFGAYAEYNQITESSFRECYYGAVNMGGNNTFTNCDFSTNVQGLLMDDSSGIFNNNSHGAYIGCTFNHSDSNTGKAIELNAMIAGQIFSACNFFYGSIDITASRGIIFNACNFGNSSPINITGAGGITFNGCAFRYNESPTTITGNTQTHFDNCRYLDGVLIVGTPA